MKRTATILALAILLVFTGGISAQPIPTPDWHTETVFTSTGTSTTAGSAINVGGASACLVTFTSTSTSSATFSVEGSIDGTTYWTTLGTASDPAAAAPKTWAGPCMKYMRFNPSAHASGTLKGYLSWRQMAADPIGHEWKLVTQATNSFGAVSATTLTASSLTSGRCALTSTAGLLIDSSAALCTASLFTLPSLKVSDLTATRVPYATTAGQLIDASSFTFTTSGGILAATQVNGIFKSTPTTKLTDGAIAKTAGTVFITKGSALGSSTVAQPTSTTDDGLLLRIVSTTAYAHVVSCASGGINGGTTTTVTFTSAAIGDSVTLVAYQGVWYVVGTTGTITLT